MPGTSLDELAAQRPATPLPPGLRELAPRFADAVLELLFGHFGDGRRAPEEQLDVVRGLLDAALRIPGPHGEDLGERFVASLAGVRSALVLDARAIYDGDPAATSVDEVVLAYPGFLATAVYRVAHELQGGGLPLFPRLLAEVAHRRTGIDIHPGARIGASFGIDHGTGVVIGETAVLGDRVRLYQGVTLGAAVVAKRFERTKRHPTIGDDVVIYANATILGGDTTIGARSLIGGNVWLTRSVPPDSIVAPTARVERARSGGGDDELLEFNI